MNSNRITETKQLLEFIQKSPTAFQAVSQIAACLEQDGFLELKEVDPWALAAGGKYYVTRNQSSVIAFTLPRQTAKCLLLSASHTDSPMFKVKPNDKISVNGAYLLLNTEPYGGTILSSWLDRPLSLAGRAILNRNGVFTAVSVHFDQDLLLIPNVAIHLNRSVNSGQSWNPAVDLRPVLSQNNELSLKALLAERLNCVEEEIVGADLYVYNRMNGIVWGAENEFFSAPRIDNLMCAYGTLRGFLAAGSTDESLNVYYAADNEETGSSTKQGAGSVFLSDVLNRICEAMAYDRRRLLASSMMVSADNGHALHPNHGELSDVHNAPKMNGGVVIKTNAAQKYATEGLSMALFGEVCRRAGVPVQYYANRSDQPGGSTLGSISNTLVPLCTVDIGMAQLAMHSAYETAGCADVAYLISAMTEFYRSVFLFQGDGQVVFAEREGN
ncbi:MAG: M18 family aminopeptidase [Ruminococcaceae bacterium]|nr:M18 family aminopeptidase [Oscillospiraceae bacterium]